MFPVSSKRKRAYQIGTLWKRGFRGVHVVWAEVRDGGWFGNVR